MATHWVILASAVTLALAGDPPAAPPFVLNCCDVNKVLPRIFKVEPTECYVHVNNLNSEHDDAVIAKGTCSMLECILDANGLRDETKSIKEQEVRTLFMDNANNEVKSIVEAALKECFETHNNRVKTDNCESGAGELFGCISKDIVMKCPNQFKKTDLPGCNDTDNTEKAADTKTEE